ncbi:hypothetical protein [Rhodococcus oryzae]|jgi:hypothetical protein|uniref:hypothetical protein n=1 Tax=Rhodococcus oryzae TaxID=2571143 RepID=UPI0037B7ECD3
MYVLLLDVEGRVLEGFLYGGLTLAEADSVRRTPPVHRDLFDDFLYNATIVAVGEGDWARFPIACRGYLSAIGGDLHRPPPLMPPDVAASVADILSQFRQRKPGDPLVAGLGRITEHQYQLAHRLFYELGGDLGDGIHVAGLRVYSKMMSARIGDGFVHPAVGGRMWGDVPAGPPHLPDSGRDVTILDTIEALSAAWRTSPADRPAIERTIVDHAHTLGWRNDNPRTAEASLEPWPAEIPGRCVDPD